MMQTGGMTADILRALNIYVDVIIGSHSHVTTGHLFYNDTLVVQGLGNFLFPMRNTPLKVN